MCIRDSIRTSLHNVGPATRLRVLIRPWLASILGTYTFNVVVHFCDALDKGHKTCSDRISIGACCPHSEFPPWFFAVNGSILLTSYEVLIRKTQKSKIVSNRHYARTLVRKKIAFVKDIKKKKCISLTRVLRTGDVMPVLGKKENCKSKLVGCGSKKN